MGSWSETCALSNLPITIGDEVYMILLTKNPYANFSSTGCYVNDFFFVRSIPLLGVYCDYGEINLCPGEEKKFELVKQQFELDLLPKEETERNRLFSIPEIKAENLSFKALLDWFHEGSVRIDSNYFIRKSDEKWNKTATELRERELKNIEKGRPTITEKMNDATKKIVSNRIENWDKYVDEVTQQKGLYSVRSLTPAEAVPVVKVFIRKDVWDSICEMNFGNWTGRKIVLEEYKKDALQYAENVVDLTEAEKKMTEEPADILEVKSFLLEMKHELLAKNDSFFGSRIGSGGAGGDAPYAMNCKEAVNIMRLALKDAKLTKEDFVENCYRLAELFFIETAMALTRQVWHITSGTGSQSENWEKTAEMHYRMAKCGAKAGVDQFVKNTGINLSSLTEEKYKKLNNWTKDKVLSAQKMLEITNDK